MSLCENYAVWCTIFAVLYLSMLLLNDSIIYNCQISCLSINSKSTARRCVEWRLRSLGEGRCSTIHRVGVIDLAGQELRASTNTTSGGQANDTFSCSGHLGRANYQTSQSFSVFAVILGTIEVCESRKRVCQKVCWQDWIFWSHRRLKVLNTLRSTKFGEEKSTYKVLLLCCGPRRP